MKSTLTLTERSCFRSIHELKADNIEWKENGVDVDMLSLIIYATH